MCSCLETSSVLLNMLPFWCSSLHDNFLFGYVILLLKLGYYDKFGTYIFLLLESTVCYNISHAFGYILSVTPRVTETLIKVISK
jgi:hypothetical protein